MNNKIIDSINSDQVRNWYDFLMSESSGCCHLRFASDDEYEYSVCMGWHDLGDGDPKNNYKHWVIAWKIGRQKFNSCMQTDFDTDFEMPYTDDGDIDDTLSVLERGFDVTAVVKKMKREAARVEREWAK